MPHNSNRSDRERLAKTGIEARLGIVESGVARVVNIVHMLPDAQVNGVVNASSEPEMAAIQSIEDPFRISTSDESNNYRVAA